MDLLKKELEKKRKEFKEECGPKKYVKRAEIEKKKLEQLKAEEEKERQRKLQLQQKDHERKQQQLQQKQLEKAKAAGGNTWGAAGGVGETGDGAAAASEEDRIDKLQLPKAEVIRRLRVLKHPVTLFGEDDEERLERLKHLMRTGDVDPDGELLEGQRNDFLRDMVELKKGGPAENARGKREKGDADKSRGAGKGSDASKARDGEGAANLDGNDQADGNGEDRETEDDEEDDVDYKRMRASFEELCEEDKILVFFKKLLREWKQELDFKPEAERRTIKGKKDVAIFKQCARYLEPLFKMCRRKQLYDDIREALLIMVRACRERDYLTAMDKYIKLAIGNAPWPIGVTMVGIHERSAREKIHTNSVAHIMNDETTRKYLQSVKRLMTLCQRRYPALPSKSVEFNSLANGSDLESLLQEEARKGDKGGQQALLRLTASKAHDEDGIDSKGE